MTTRKTDDRAEEPQPRQAEPVEPATPAADPADSPVVPQAAAPGNDAVAAQANAEDARELPEGWEKHWASEDAARAALDSMAPASVPGATKYDADGPSLHAKQHAPLGSEAAEAAAEDARQE